VHEFRRSFILLKFSFSFKITQNENINSNDEFKNRSQTKIKVNFCNNWTFCDCDLKRITYLASMRVGKLAGSIRGILGHKEFLQDS
jgi:hypothetical protein